MKDNFFEDGFRFDKYINEQLMKVQDEGERRALKELVRETLIPFYEYTEHGYNEFTKRILATKEQKYKDYEICTGVMKRNRIDVTEDMMVPMLEEDMNDGMVDIAMLKEQVKAGQPYPVMKVFLKSTYEKILELENSDRIFRGTIFTEEGEFQASFQLRRYRKYIDKLEELYRIFVNNGIQWHTICAPYIYKFFQVELVGADMLMENVIQKIVIDFEEYSECVCYDMVPMWNVRTLEERTSAYPNLAADQINFEHYIYKNRLNESKQYLVKNDVTLWNVYRQDGDLHIICEEKEPIKWELLEIGYCSAEFCIKEHLFTNPGGALGKCIHTISEVKHFVKSLGYEKELRLKDVKVGTMKPEKAKIYPVDEFIEDEIRSCQRERTLLLLFDPMDRDNYLNEDILSYLVGRTQWLFADFECVGDFI